MNPMLKVSAAVLFAAISVVPAMAATLPVKTPSTTASAVVHATKNTAATVTTASNTQSMTTAKAEVVMGTKAGLAPATALDKIIGKWNHADLRALSAASKVTVFDTKTLYSAADAKLVAETAAKETVRLGKLHAAIDADAAVKAWFSKNNLDVSRVVAVTDTKGSVAVFLS